MIRYLQKLKHKKGFTLVEMTVVIAIISVLAAMMIPSLSQYVTKAKVTAANASASSIRKNVEAYMLELALQGKGLKRGSGINAQLIFMVKNHTWMCKAECKIKIGSGFSNDTDGSKTFNDHRNWWDGNKIKLLTDNVNRAWPNHLLALCRVVADCCVDIDTGFVECFFTNGVCRGVVYIPGWDYAWPDSNWNEVPSTIRQSMQGWNNSKGGCRPLLTKGRYEDGNNYPNGAYAIPEMKPWQGVWPEVVDDRVWADGIAGVDLYGYINGTSPPVGFTSTRRG